MPPLEPLRKRALFLTPEPPGFGQGGGALRSQSLIDYLKRGYDVDIVAVPLRRHSKAVPARIVRNAGRLVRGVPPLFDRYAGYDEQIRGAIPAEHYELGVVEHFWCASYATLLGPYCDRLVLDLHNIESQLARTHAAALMPPAKWASERFAKVYERLEAEWLPRFDTLLVTSDSDRARVSHRDVVVFANALPEIPLPRVEEGNAIIFSGNLEYHPNIEAVRWFAGRIWPTLHAQLPNAEWRLVGRNPEAIRGLVEGLPRVNVVGPVDDAIAALAAAKVCVVPLLSGSGTRFKILEAWAAGRAVVSTTLGAEGLRARAGAELLLADDAVSFVNAVVALWNDASQRQRMGAAGRALYLDRFTWSGAWKSLEAAGL